jgi:hypothetical protein
VPPEYRARSTPAFMALTVPDRWLTWYGLRMLLAFLTRNSSQRHATTARNLVRRERPVGCVLRPWLPQPKYDIRPVG